MPTSQINRVVQHLRRAVLWRDVKDLADAQLLERFLTQQEEAALDALVRRHAPMVLGVCRRVLRNHHDVEDAFQAAFLVLVRKAASIRPREMVANWLYGVAYNTAIKARATTARLRSRERQAAPMPEPEAAPRTAWSDLQPCLDEELQRLPDKYRVPIVLCDLEGKSHKEAARQLHWPQGTLSGRLSRGRVMLAKRLSRRGLVLSGGSLAFILSQNAASACVPAVLVSATAKAAALLAAGHAGVAGVISVKVTALTEGVLKSMLLVKLKSALMVVLLVSVLGLGAGVLAHRALADREVAAALTAAQPRGTQRTEEALASVTAKVVAASKDGKTITLEVPSQVRGEEAKRTDIRITDKTEVVYHGVGTNGAKPTEDYQAQVFFQAGSSDTAARVNFSVVDRTRERGYFSAPVAAVSQDGKTITLEFPVGREPDAGKKKIDFKLTDKTKITYAYAAKDAAKPAEGYQAELWLEEGTRDTPADGVAKAHFTNLVRSRQFEVGGKLVGVSKDGSVLTLEVPPKERGQDSQKAAIKLTATTEITYSSVGPDGAKLTEGYHARVWLEDGSTDTAAKITLGRADARGR